MSTGTTQFAALMAVTLAMSAAFPVHAQDSKPNILVIMADDIGPTQVSAYGLGIVGYRTPNIDRLASEGMLFTDYYAEQSCTAGRSSFITGQTIYRTGLSKVGLPGADLGLQPQDPTIAELLKPHGYATGQFGKNHLGDLDKYLPTNHGFDEFFGNLYHLNAEEEPENHNYPTDPEFKEKYGPRGVIKSYADGRIQDTGPLTRERMESIDDETTEAAMEFMERQTQADKPFFLWYSPTRMHLYTHVRADRRDEPGLTARTEYADGMLEHDMHVGMLLDKLDELGIADNTIVLYTSDNGPYKNSWPDAGVSPFRSEKETSWEGAFRVPALIRWPGKIDPGQISTEIVSGLDWLPTFVAAAGDPEITSKLLKGYRAGKQSFKVQLDGFNLLPYLTGDEESSPRESFFYFNDDKQLVGIRFHNWKLVFLEQDAQGTSAVWAEPFTELRLPKMFDLRADPYEQADITSKTYYDWQLRHAFLIVPAQQYVAQFLETLKKFPPRQPPASFNLEEVVRTLSEGTGD